MGMSFLEGNYPFSSGFKKNAMKKAFFFLGGPQKKERHLPATLSLLGDRGP